MCSIATLCWQLTTEPFSIISVCSHRERVDDLDTYIVTNREFLFIQTLQSLELDIVLVIAMYEWIRASPRIHRILHRFDCLFENISNIFPPIFTLTLCSKTSTYAQICSIEKSEPEFLGTSQKVKLWFPWLWIFYDSFLYFCGDSPSVSAIHYATDYKSVFFTFDYK